ncbi:MAG: hypothetical protein LBI27_04780, partial [Clostridiales bacterium]|nr:hypothetical protein [Clostridiales bacterium]
VKRVETHIEIITAKKRLISLNKAIDELLTPKDGTKPNIADEEEALRYLLIKISLLDKAGQKLRPSINKIIALIEESVGSNDPNRIKHNLSAADIEARLILEIVDDVFDIK